MMTTHAASRSIPGPRPWLPGANFLAFRRDPLTFFTMIARTYGDLAQRTGYMKEPKGYKSALWQQYAELGLLGVPFAEEHGGLGQGLTETMIIAEAFGGALAEGTQSPTLRSLP